jgi:hypothetical protein
MEKPSRASTVNRITFPVDAGTRALWGRLLNLTYDDFLGVHPAEPYLRVLAEADAADHNAIRNLLYAYRSGQL